MNDSGIRLPVVALILAFVVLVVVGCGSDSGGAASEAVVGARVSDDGRSYTFDEFTAVGFKKNKSYDVSELPSAESAYYGFWGLDPYNREDFELRFYPSHADAVEHGTDLAEERTGEDAKLTDSTATWTVGVKDARECHGLLMQSAHAATCLDAKYYDYMIVGNLVLLCPGDAVDVARENCDELLAQLQ
ncbi:MAG: hypothetical protein QF357_00565 [Dehalococcoidia bacterium]|nr:hypothetical protein [Dehalococcoidia bacterium]